MLLIRRFRSMRSNDPQRGSALLAVIGVMAVAAIIAVVIVSMSMHSIGYTTSTRATVQARAAAEAGIDAAAANIAGSVCQSSYSSATTPAYSVAVSYSTSVTTPLSGGWTSGCPTSVAAKWLKLVSTGTAADPGLVGNSSGDTRSVEAIYPYTPTPPTNGVPVSGAALYSSNIFDSTLTNFTVSPANPQPYVEVLNGDIKCTTPTTIYANIILAGGDVTTNSNCTISGDLYASGTVTVSGDVTGNVYSTGATGPQISGKVYGSVYSANGASISGTVLGNIVSGPGTAPVTGNGTVGGTVTAAGSVSNKLTIKGAPALQNQSGIVTPVIPNVPKWSDYTYSTYAVDGVKWTTAAGTAFADVTLTATMCAGLASTVAALTVPSIVDTRACGASTTVPSLTLQTDVVIIGNGLQIVNSPHAVDIKSNNSQERRLWLVVPDAVGGNSIPDCPAGSGGVTIGNNTDIHAVAEGNPVAAMLYSPCPISNQGFAWNGQLYVASINSNSDAVLTPNPLGLPGQNLDDPNNPPPGFPGTGSLGDRSGMRDLAGG